MEVERLDLKGLLLISPRIHGDERGFFYESYRAPILDAMGVPRFVQDNVVGSKRGVIRGLHYQKKPGQAKLVSCLQGRILDVAVDIRPDSATRGQWRGVILDDVARKLLFVPVGFAHGYAVLSEEALVSYKVSALYDPLEEGSIRWDDPTLRIEWPIASPLLSLRDRQAPPFDEVLYGSLGSRR
jgi:dTDP-4-dehydrorhamnose 3,5-epimerase